MKKIGAGLQFNVYDFGNGLVLKKPRCFIAQYFKYLSWRPWKFYNPFWFIDKIKKANIDANNACDFFKKNKGALKLIGNIKFTKDGIIQDKVIPIKELINKTFAKDKKIINKYAKFIMKCWRFGFADKVYNFQVNNGIDKNGDVILLDFGELFFKKEKITKDMKRKAWLNRAGYFKLNKNTKKYYKNKMDKVFTIKNLNKYWK